MTVEIPLMKMRACLALAEETEAAREDLYSLLPRFPEEALRTGNVETEDNPRGILTHVTSSFFSYACWIDRVLGRLDPGAEKAEKSAFLQEVRGTTTATGFEALSRFAAERYYRALAEITGPEFDMEFKTNWGGTMSIESMLEHALVHLMRHRRQLQVHLGLRPPGEVRA